MHSTTTRTNIKMRTFPFDISPKKNFTLSLFTIGILIELLIYQLHSLPLLDSIEESARTRINKKKKNSTKSSIYVTLASLFPFSFFIYLKRTLQVKLNVSKVFTHLKVKLQHHQTLLNLYTQKKLYQERKANAIVLFQTLD